jgi:hypothetical protein
MESPSFTEARWRLMKSSHHFTSDLTTTMNITVITVTTAVDTETAEMAAVTMTM